MLIVYKIFFLSLFLPMVQVSETFEKGSILFKVKEGENFNCPAWGASGTGRARGRQAFVHNLSL